MGRKSYVSQSSYTYVGVRFCGEREVVSDLPHFRRLCTVDDQHEGTPVHFLSTVTPIVIKLMR